MANWSTHLCTYLVASITKNAYNLGTCKYTTIVIAKLMDLPLVTLIITNMGLEWIRFLILIESLINIFKQNDF
jgi:hypothetical protein